MSRRRFDTPEDEREAHVEALLSVSALERARKGERVTEFDQDDLKASLAAESIRAVDRIRELTTDEGPEADSDRAAREARESAEEAVARAGSRRRARRSARAAR
jgi:hypothetical protein